MERGESWRWQLERQWGLAGARAWRTVGVGQPWGWQVAFGSRGRSRGGPAGGQGQLAADLAEPGLGASCSLSQAAPRPGWGCCSPGPASGPPSGPGMTRTGRFLLQSPAPSGPPAAHLPPCSWPPPSPSGHSHPAGPWRGQGQVLGSFPERGRTPGAVAIGTAEQHHWLEDKQAGFLTSDCREDSLEDPAGVDGEVLPGGCRLWRGDWSRGVLGSQMRTDIHCPSVFFPKHLLGSASQELTWSGAGSPPNHLAP